jgi:hypothetical protein
MFLVGQQKPAHFVSPWLSNSIINISGYSPVLTVGSGGHVFCMCVVSDCTRTIAWYIVQNSNFFVLCYWECSVDEYPFDELVDMHLIYDSANGNGQRVAYPYQETFPH